MLIEDSRRTLAAVFRANGSDIECAYAFGSRARGDAGSLSDLDVGVLFAESVVTDTRLDRAAALVERLEQLTDARVDITVLNDAPLALRHRVVRDGLVLWAPDDRRRVAFERARYASFSISSLSSPSTIGSCWPGPERVALAPDEEVIAA